MHRIFFIGLLAVSSNTASEPGEMTDPPELWRKAVLIAGQNARWSPGRWQEVETTFDSHGNVEEEITRIVRFLPAGKRAPRVVLESARAGGREVSTADFEPDDYRVQPEDRPFDPDLQSQIKVTALGQTRNVDGVLTSGFAYRQRTSTGDWTGTAWLEAQSGMPLLVISQPLVMPPEIDGLQINDLQARSYYHHDHRERWYPRRIELDLDIAIKVGWLVVFRGQTQVRITPSQYWQRDPDPEAGPVDHPGASALER